MPNNYYPERNFNIDIPNVFQSDLDESMVSDLSHKIITETQNAEMNRVQEEEEGSYHVERLVEQARAMSREEALIMCQHFGEDILIEALRWHAELNKKFINTVIEASREVTEV